MLKREEAIKIGVTICISALLSFMLCYSLIKPQIGPVGLQGEPGTVGDSITGIPGPQGERGVPGIQGPVGESIVGPQGERGIQGIPGLQGEKGKAGDPAFSWMGVEGIETLWRLGVYPDSDGFYGTVLTVSSEIWYIDITISQGPTTIPVRVTIESHVDEYQKESVTWHTSKPFDQQRIYFFESGRFTINVNAASGAVHRVDIVVKEIVVTPEG